MTNHPLPPVLHTQLFINDTFVDAESKKKFTTFNPTNGEKIIDVAEGDKADIDKAVRAARQAFNPKSSWRTMDTSSRGSHIRLLANLIERDANHLANLETLDNGKPINDSKMDIMFSVNVLRYYSSWCDKIHGHTIPCDGGYFAMTLKQPVGVVGQIIPWNYPIMMIAWKWGPALATGCTIVLKPAEQTPLTALYLASLAQEAGFPPGVINVVTGFGPTAGAALAGHRDVDKISFTGSTESGRIILEAAARTNLKRVSTNMGAKCPLIVCEDADVEKAALLAYRAAFENQCCCAATRTFVHSKVYDKFLSQARVLAENRNVGDPYDSNTDQGPQIDEKQFNKVLRLIDSGKKEGAVLVAGGQRIGTSGFFIQPTVFSDVTDDMEVCKEEIPGPVQCILKFETYEEVIARANNSKYGLAAGIVTKNIDRAFGLAKALDTGSVWINDYNIFTPQTPFGGFKMSGNCRELGEDSLNEYLETKTVVLRIGSVK